MNNPALLTVLYLAVSLVVFLAFYLVSKELSGAGFKLGRFWLFFIVAMLWGAVQLNVARHGYILLFLPSRDVFESNYLIRWIAFISAIAQATCVPSKEKPRRWFSRH